MAILTEGEAGIAVPELLRTHIIGRRTRFLWKSKSGEVSVKDRPYARTAHEIYWVAAAKRLKADARMRIERWRRHYDRVRPHGALQPLPPAK